MHNLSLNRKIPTQKYDIFISIVVVETADTGDISQVEFLSKILKFYQSNIRQLIVHFAVPKLLKE